jgi:hypothetical protein
MARVRVGALDLNLVAPEALRARGGGLVETSRSAFVPAVLRALHARLARTYGDEAVIRIRTLKMRCALQPEALDTGDVAAIVGDELAAQVERAVEREHGGGALPDPSASVLVFRDAAHVDAVALLDAVQSRKSFAGSREDVARVWARIARAPPERLAAVLLRCAEAQGLERVLACLRPATLRALDAALGARAPAQVAAAVVAALRATAARATSEVEPPESRGADADDAPFVAEPTERAAADAAPAGRLAAAPLHEVGLQDPRGPPDADEGAALESRAAPSAGACEPPGRAPEPESRQAPHVPPARAADRAAATPKARARRVEHDAGELLLRPDAPPPVVSLETGWCGVLYLLNVTLKLELPERLWQIGVDEGAVLAAMFGRVIGTRADPAANVVASSFPAAPAAPPALPEWARAELVDGAFGAAMRLRVAAVSGADAFRRRVAALEAQLASGADFDVAAWGAALHLAVAETLLGAPLDRDALAARFARPGRIEVDDAEIRVVQPLDAIDIDVRRAALDADPGWLAWRGRTLVFRFAESGDAEGA